MTLRVAQYNLAPEVRSQFMKLDPKKQDRITKTRTDFTDVFEATGLRTDSGRSVILDQTEWTITIVNNIDQINLFENLLTINIKNTKIKKSEPGRGPNSLTLVGHD